MQILALGLVLLLASPATSRGLDFASAAKYSTKKNGLALVVWHNGVTHSQFAEGFHERSPFNVFSITKSLTALTCLSQLSPDSIVPPHAHPGAKMTLANCLSQTSGLVPSPDRLYRNSLLDIQEAVARVPRTSVPGSTFAYGPSHFEVLGRALSPVHENPITISLLRPLGIVPASWRTDRRGNFYLSAGAELTPADLLKIGRLILNNGRVSWFQSLIPRERLRRAFTGTAANPAYGLGFWLNSCATVSGAVERDAEQSLSLDLRAADWARTCLSRSAPGDLVAMVGSGGQRVYISPSLQLVVVRIGRPSRFRDPEFLRCLLTGPAR